MESFILQMPIERVPNGWCWDGHEMLRPSSGPGEERRGSYMDPRMGGMSLSHHN